MIDEKGRDYFRFSKNNSNSGFSIYVSEDSTNGDVIKALFPNATMHIFECLNSVNVITDETLNAQTFDLEWWNAPYKRGETNE